LADQEDVAAEHLGQIFRPLLIQQLGFRLPVQPAGVEGAVGVADDAATAVAQLEQGLAHSWSGEAGRVVHQGGHLPRDVGVAHRRIEIAAQSRFQNCPIHVHQGGVTAGLDAGVGDGKQLRQPGPGQVGAGGGLAAEGPTEFELGRQRVVVQCIQTIQSAIQCLQLGAPPP